CANSKKE
ncbi:hypothetical protein D043_2685B, partial [Vibrio parahaemolyticus EKP-021]